MAMPLLRNLVTCCSSAAPATDCWCVADTNMQWLTSFRSRHYGILRTSAGAASCCRSGPCLVVIAAQSHWPERGMGRRRYVILTVKCTHPLASVKKVAMYA
jgi:hypothetical protein